MTNDEGEIRMVEEKPIEELTFREAMAELDRIVGVLESNSLELERLEKLCAETDSKNIA